MQYITTLWHRITTFIVMDTMLSTDERYNEIILTNQIKWLHCAYNTTHIIYICDSYNIIGVENNNKLMDSIL